MFPRWGYELVLSDLSLCHLYVVDLHSVSITNDALKESETSTEPELTEHSEGLQDDAPRAEVTLLSVDDVDDYSTRTSF